ncbi:hypothetical protein ABEB36_008310 [Hypothenemus hampei]|uniref:MADF domain-containing protein n=1 Tax=Hypothenemus hampei TaxID=57062 RepID=A0ABD1ELH8_HYPHA
MYKKSESNLLCRNTEKLISEIKKRPGLYNKKVKEYSDKDVRERLWNEVCRAIIPDWFELSDGEQDRTVIDVQRRWKNVRDCFMKEIRYQKSFKDGNTKKKKRRKYLFYDHLSFLLPTLLPSSCEHWVIDEDQATSSQDHLDKSNHQIKIQSVFHVPDKEVEANKNISSKPLTDTTNIEIDEDGYFLLSLLPTLQKLSHDQKMYVKIEFLQILRNTTNIEALSSSKQDFKDEMYFESE